MTTRARINRELFSQVEIDSGSLSMLSTIVHRFSEPGEYEGIVTKGDRGVVARRFTITVAGGSSTATQADSSGAGAQHDSAQPGQVKIDLKNTTTPDRFVLNAGGYAVFYVSAGPGGYVVQVSKLGKDNASVTAFDSRELKEGDILSATVIRPGTYSITNSLNNAKAELVVNYPEPGKMQLSPRPVSIECTSNQIMPDKLRIDPMQGLVFTFKTTSRIKINLINPEDRLSRLRSNQLRAREHTLGQKKGEKKIIRRFRLMPSGSRI
jgi:hypothetical protein